MITVDQLVNNHSLGLTYKAGRSGGSRVVAWAHAVDLPDHWRWVLPGTLVMTTGGGVPIHTDEQVEWIRKLASSKASALVFAPRDYAPEFSEEMLYEASELGFPILGAGYELEFVKLAQLVIENVLQAKRDQFDTGNKLFQIYADSLWQTSDLQERMILLGKKLSAEMQIINKESSKVIFSTSPSDEVFKNAIQIQIPGRAKAILNISNKHSQYLDETFLSRILAGLLSLELERGMIERDGKRKEGEVLFHDLLSGEIEYGAAKTMLDRRNLTGKLITIAIEPSQHCSQKYTDLHHIQEFYSFFPLFSRDENRIFIVLPDDQKLLEGLINYFGSTTKIGISSPITAMVGFKESIFQACLALARITDGASLIAHYSHLDSELALGPKTVAEARSLVGHFLGPILEYEQHNALPLLKTIAVFLECDGNWKTTAAKLHIHRQTLVYRLKIIEEITGIKPTSSLGITKLWIALDAAKTIGLLDFLE